MLTFTKSSISGSLSSSFEVISLKLTQIQSLTENGEYETSFSLDVSLLSGKSLVCVQQGVVIWSQHCNRLVAVLSLFWFGPCGQLSVRDAPTVTGGTKIASTRHRSKREEFSVTYAIIWFPTHCSSGPYRNMMNHIPHLPFKTWVTKYWPLSALVWKSKQGLGMTQGSFCQINHISETFKMFDFVEFFSDERQI